LILATQRPSGVVSDQMRANMKFRMCLRVETAEDSREMLGRNDAATLPAIGGRGYVQVGGGPLNEVQAAWSGAPYDETKPDPVYPVSDILDALDKPADAPRSLLGWLVGALAAEAKRQNIPKQFKPWPDPLPKVLPLNKPVNAEYIQNGRLGNQVVINPAVADWINNPDAKPLWKPVDWKSAMSLDVPVGILDNPYSSEQRVLKVDLSGDPIVVFGAAGRGKSTFLKSLIISMASVRSPADLHIYVLDFGRGGLKALRPLPHIAGIVDTNEEERVERLLRVVRTTIDDRQQKLQAYDSLTDYNTKHPDDALPMVVVVIDNVSEFKELYERFLMELGAMVRDGRSFGVYFVATATLMIDVPSKLFNILTQRYTFTQSDAGDYTTIVGRGWSRFNDEPGRGLAVELVGETPVPLEFHTAVPVGEGEADPYRELAQCMAKAWASLESQSPQLKAKRARPVEPLTKLIDVASILPAIGAGSPARAVPVGINDLNREPAMIEFGAKGPHLIVIGPPVTGKSSMLRSLVLSLAHCYPPDRVAMVLVDPSDPSRRFFSFGGNGDNRLDKLPHVLATVTNTKELDEAIKRLQAEYDEQVIEQLKGRPDVFRAQNNQARTIYVIIDHYDDAESTFKGNGMSALSEAGKGKNLSLVIGGTLNIMRSSSDDLRRRAESARYTVVLQDYETVRYMGVRGSFSVNKELPPGRGFLIKAVSASMIQAAMPYAEGKNGLSAEEQLDGLIGAIRAKYPQPAQWSYYAKDLAALETAIKGEEGGAAEVQQPAGAQVAPPPEASAAMSELAELLKMQAGMGSIEIPDADPSQMVSLELPDEPGNGNVPPAEPQKQTAAEGGSTEKKSKKK
ncbi:MAG: FtsK/SpoIIIE domain-containing protein, partial [Chloroflexota bacterium]